MCVGIDVANAELVISVLPSAERFTVEHDERGVRTVVQRVASSHLQLIGLEATGGYELLAVAALAAALAARGARVTLVAGPVTLPTPPSASGSTRCAPARPRSRASRRRWRSRWSPGRRLARSSARLPSGRPARSPRRARGRTPARAACAWSARSRPSGLAARCEPARDPTRERYEYVGIACYLPAYQRKEVVRICSHSFCGTLEVLGR